MARGNPFGTHRVLEPLGVMPQAAKRLDCDMRSIYDNEILVDVERLNIDAASFTQLEEEGERDTAKIAGLIKKIIKERGKMHNPVTGSGGMFIGTVRRVGADLVSRDLKPGDKIASLVSLSLTPLALKRIKKIDLEKDQVEVEAQAVLFESGVYAKLPADLPDRLCLALLDVAGAPAQTARLVKPGDAVLVIGGGGKSGLLCLYEAKKRAGVTGRVIGLGHSASSTERIRESGFADLAIQGDASKPLEVYEKILEVTDGKLMDVTINCVNIPGTEMASIMSTREGGIVYFFTMATSFTAAALGAEGIGKDVNMIIGNGFAKGHDRITLELMRESPKLRALFERMFL
ncbi:MAG: L-erythro-3,5-diaminohexanoate dehydrogenase [bacterium]